MAGRIALAAAVAVVGLAATCFSLAEALRSQSPSLALSLAPYDAGALATQAEGMLSPGEQRLRPGVAARFAERALRRDATNASAVASLGTATALKNDLPRARLIFAYGQTLSRRDLQTQLWAIEDAVALGRIDEALHHYDIALRTSTSAPGLLYPILAKAISDPQIRAATAKTLSAQPAWGQTFVRQLATSGPDFRSVTDLFNRLRGVYYVFPEGAHASLIAGLISQNDFDRAWLYYAAVHPASQRDTSRDPVFAATDAVPSAFDWNPVQSDGISSAIQAGQGSSSLLTFDMSPGQSGLVIRQLEVLPPGRYRLEGRSRGNLGDNPPYWTLACLDGAELGRVELGGGDKFRLFAGGFTVPPGCPVQWLSLIGRSTSGTDSLSGEIARVSLRPLL